MLKFLDNYLWGSLIIFCAVATGITAFFVQNIKVWVLEIWLVIVIINTLQLMASRKELDKKR